VTQFGRPPVLGSNEQIFGVNGQILGRYDASPCRKT
jgi:hypothetical protein